MSARKTTPWLKLRSGEWISDDENFWLCASELRRVVSVPRQAKEIRGVKVSRHREALRCRPVEEDGRLKANIDGKVFWLPLELAIWLSRPCNVVVEWR